MAFGAGGGPNCPRCWNGRGGQGGPNEAQSGPEGGGTPGCGENMAGGAVVKRGRSRMWVTTVSKCSDVTRFGTCMAVAGWGKIDKMSMERVYCGHRMVHQPWKGGC